MAKRPKHPERRTVTGTVASFDENEGWGVITAPETPGGCFVDYSVVRIEGYRFLTPSQRVQFTFNELASPQDGYRYRALDVWPDN